MINLKDFKKHKDWIKVWSGKWSLLFDSHQGYWWTQNNSIAGKPPYRQMIHFCEHGITDCWVSAKDKDYLGKRLSAMAVKNTKYIYNVTNGLVKNGKKIENFILRHNAKDIQLKNFNEFWEICRNYYFFHLSVKYVVDYLSAQQLKKYLPKLESVRVSAESFTRNAENYLENLAKYIATNTSYSKEMILSTTGEELSLFFLGGKLPNKVELLSRYKKSALFFNKNGYKISSGKKVGNIRKIVISNKNAKIIKGQSAYKGIAKGNVKIIVNPLKEASKFKQGDVLVTGMTRPEFLPLMLKAAAIVTDAGGILSHAAITAREIKKPTIIGTKIATEIFKDGDLVEVDANKGIVKNV